MWLKAAHWDYKRILTAIFLVLYFSLFFLVKADLSSSDLGRHLINGQLILSGNTKVLFTNYYSYTQPDHVFLNHHWLTGVVFYLVYQVSGFDGLVMLSAVVNGLTMYILFSWLSRKSNTFVGLFLTFLYLIFATARIEIRPEMFTYLFVLLLFISLDSQRPLNSKKVIPLLLMQILWVNLHIFFVFAFAITGAFIIAAYLQKDFVRLRQLLIFLVLQILVSCLNPFGIRGLLQPFNIFTDYGLRPVETLPLSYNYEKYGLTPFIITYVMLVLLALLVTLITVLSKKKPVHIPSLCLFVIFFIGSLKMIRLVSLFGLFAIILFNFLAAAWLPFIADILSRKVLYIDAKKLLLIAKSYFIFVAIMALTALNIQAFGIGLKPGMADSANFFTINKINGPIFNNFDIGSYLIFYLYGKEKVFVDNRPEAYSAAFFKNTYLPLTNHTDVWESTVNKYGINALYVKHDQNYRNFTAQRLNDPMWKLIYSDNYALIFVKDTDKNRELIEKYELKDTALNTIRAEYL